jgi:hypothetical protein
MNVNASLNTQYSVQFTLDDSAFMARLPLNIYNCVAVNGRYTPKTYLNNPYLQNGILIKNTDVDGVLAPKTIFCAESQQTFALVAAVYDLMQGKMVNYQNIIKFPGQRFSTQSSYFFECYFLPQIGQKIAQDAYIAAIDGEFIATKDLRSFGTFRGSVVLASQIFSPEE